MTRVPDGLSSLLPPATWPLAWAVLVLLVAFRAVGAPHRLGGVGRPAGRPSGPGPVTRLGGFVRRWGRGRSDVDGSVGGRWPGLEDRTVGWAVLVVAAAVVVMPVVALPAGGAVVARPWWRRRVAERRRIEAVAAELPWLAALVRIGVGAGLPVGRALEEAARRGRGPAAAAVLEAVERTARGGSLADAVDGLRVPFGEDGRPLVAALTASIRHGAPIGQALDAVSADLRLRARRRAEVRARRVPVRMLFPLVTCILPAFVLLSVVPLVATSLRDLGVGA